MGALQQPRAHGDVLGPGDKKFTVTAHDRTNDVTYSEEFDNVVVASGHFSTPNVPYFEGIETFNGRVLHSHDFRDAMEFKGKDILIIGRSYSAEDIGSQCYKYGAKSITSSYRSKPMGFKWPENWKEVPLLQKVVEEDPHFEDGTKKDVDAIILCTGYLHHFPFLPEDLRLKTGNRLWPSGLYKGSSGKPIQDFSTSVCRTSSTPSTCSTRRPGSPATSSWAASSCPRAEAMRQHSQEWREREETLENAEQMIWFQGDYTKELIDQTDYPSFDIEGVNQTFMEWEHHKARKHHGLPRQRLSLADDRHDGADAPHAVAAGDGRFAGELSGGEGGGGGVGGIRNAEMNRKLQRRERERRERLDSIRMALDAAAADPKRYTGAEVKDHFDCLLAEARKLKLLDRKLSAEARFQ